MTEKDDFGSAFWFQEVRKDYRELLNEIEELKIRCVQYEHRLKTLESHNHTKDREEQLSKQHAKALRWSLIERIIWGGILFVVLFFKQIWERITGGE